jgi:hypothetical protein
MKKQNLSDLDVPTLKQKEKTLTMILAAFLGILTVMAVFIIFLFIQKQNTIALPLVAVFFSLIAVLVSSRSELNAIKTEIESRDTYL